MTLLVTYASSYGSTQEMALTLADDLQAAGHKVDVRPVEEVTILDSYAAVIMGTPIHCGLLSRPMHQFLYKRVAMNMLRNTISRQKSMR
jgi:menaquinone-dependent protoporphyrinogen oxidase